MQPDRGALRGRHAAGACRRPGGRSWCATTSTECVGRCRAKALAARPQTLWRYRELLPVRRPENVLSLGEVVTPLVPLPRLAARFAGGGELLVKDEGRLPTGSFKARGLALAVSMAKELGVHDDGDADQRQRRRGDGGLLRAGRDQGLCLLPGRHPGGQCARDRDAGRRGVSRRRADRRLRPARRRGRKGGRLVQLLDPARALSDRGQEDDGHRTRRAARLGPCPT